MAIARICIYAYALRQLHEKEVDYVFSKTHKFYHPGRFLPASFGLEPPAACLRQ